MLSYLAPDLQAMILEGRQPAGIDLAALIRQAPPLDWRDQRAWLTTLS